MRFIVIGSLLLAGIANAHMAIYHEAMWCFNGNETGQVNLNTNHAVNPLYNMTKADWWMHHVNGCDEVPPAAGKFLELPVGQEITVEVATARAFTSWSYDGKFVTEWGDGGAYNWDNHVDCIQNPNLHTQNKSMAAGTALAISYTSDLSQVTPENLAVFSVAYNTPFKMLTKYAIPADLPACPEEGCICVWGWVPNGCGTSNMYMEALRCKVIGATSTTPVAPAKPPVWCEGDESKCTAGSKQLIYWHQKEGNNIEVDGYDLAGWHKSPAYNSKCGWANGAQNDIFQTSPAKANSLAVSSSVVVSSSTPVTSPSLMTIPLSATIPSSVTTPSSATIPSSIPSLSSVLSSPSEPSNSPGWTKSHGHRPHHTQGNPGHWKRTKNRGFPHSN